MCGRRCVWWGVDVAVVGAGYVAVSVAICAAMRVSVHVAECVTLELQETLQ